MYQKCFCNTIVPNSKHEKCKTLKASLLLPMEESYFVDSVLTFICSLDTTDINYATDSFVKKWQRKLQ